MSKFNKKKSGDLPAISTASLPDIVFMLLFFFMVATVMRDNTLKIKNELPSADQVEKLDKKDLVMYIYVGQPTERYQSQFGKESRIQLNDKFADVSDIKAFIAAERASKREELIPFLTTALKVDKEANMGLIGDIKQELREENALKINYTTKQGDISANRK
ncbi:MULTISPECIES: ExbD/TolR family protein [Flavobacteriaceae]|jgi:biopolymer transport protein ExbD|uniref:Biopolymer transporter ExbD n=2 Tax=Flavobacteriaceae TaxID=49546 RepID=A0ABP3UIU2_9FLAO|nr:MULTISPECIES: biopolymer transporter ExbD [Flavobacteriaceae]RYH73487.1 biopolymer transporter ExbD [Flavobacteriaceae bacterium 144Ye]TBV25205.1 biopolymer transporter ExbD [Meridianimaribacter sp. CL38]TDY10621.1 biopolymer transport protein ExbD [Meridianimaribacter flavus]